MNARIDDDAVLGAYVQLTRGFARIPVKGDLLLKRRTDPSFPSDKSQLLSRIRDYCSRDKGFEDVLALLPDAVEAERPRSEAPAVVLGYVYLLKSGKHYKIGMTNSVGRREREFAVLLPEYPRTVHTIRTDDPVGIERYWHNRFAAKRVKGEWFKLDAADVAAFRRRTFQ